MFLEVGPRTRRRAGGVAVDVVGDGVTCGGRVTAVTPGRPTTSARLVTVRDMLSRDETSVAIAELGSHLAFASGQGN